MRRNYTLTQPAGLTANITAVGVTITSGITANNKVYDGTTAATISSNNVVLSGVLPGDVANVRLNTNGYVANFGNGGVANGIGVTVSGMTLSGTSATNYTLTQPAGLTANITRKPLTVNSVPSPLITIHPTNNVVTIAWNSVAGGVYRVQYNNNLNGTNWNDLSPDVTAAGSTAVQTNVVTGVTQRFYRIKVMNSGITANNKTYDGTTVATINSNNVVLVGVLGGDTVSLSTNGYFANFATPNVGIGIVVTVSGLTLGGPSATNYTLTQPADLTANITPAGVTINSGITANNKTYDGTTAATISSNNVVLNGVTVGDAANVRLNTNGYAANFAGASAGTGVGVLVGGLTLTGSAAGNYTLSQLSGLTANITRVGVTITSGVGANNKTYDGTITATIISNNVVLSGVLPGDVVNVRLNTNGYTANFANAGVANGIGVTLSGLTLAGTGAANYTLTQPLGLTANITKAGVTIASGISANSKQYDGATAATVSSNNVILNGVITGETANVRLNTNGYTANFASAGAANGVGLTVSGLTLAGTAAANYALTQPAGLTANITRKPLTVNSVPSPLITIHPTNNVVTIAWNSVAGGVYRVQYNNNLNGTNWNDLSPDVTAAGSTAVQTNVVTGVTQRFYRIKVMNSGITANNKTYDGTTVATINSNNVVLVGVLGGDTVSLSTNGNTAAFIDAGVGNNKAVTISGLTLAGANATNYTLSVPALTANITPATLTVSAIDRSRTFGLSNPVFSVTYSGFVHSEGTNVLTGAPSLVTSATTNSPPGSYAIMVGAGTLSAANYNFSFADGTLTVVSAPQLNGFALNGNQIVFNWSTIAAQSYQLEYKDSLNATNWTLLGGVLPGTGSPIIVTNTLGAPSQRFFRLVISP